MEGISLLGPLPKEIQNFTVYSGAVHVNARSAAQAQVSLRYFQSQAARAAMVKAGMEAVVPDAP